MNRKKQYDRLKMLKLASRSAIGTLPQPKVVPSKLKKAPRYKETYDQE
jgi:hypothetical protein